MRHPPIARRLSLLVWVLATLSSALAWLPTRLPSTTRHSIVSRHQRVRRPITMMMVVPRFHQQRSIFPLQSSNIHNDDVDVDDDDDDELNTDTSIISSLDSSSADPLIDEADFEDFRCGFVSIIGAPNMGKSTLLNALLEENLSITTPRPQTTRHAIVGLLTKPDCQVCLVDTPGVIGEPAYKLQENMMEAVMGAFFDADVLMVVTDVFSTPVNDDSLFDKLQQTDKPTIVCINKVDLIDKINVTAAALSEEQEIGVLPKTVTVEEAVQRWRQLLPNAMAILPMAASQGAADLGVIALRTILTGGPDVPAALRNLGRPIPYMFHEQAKLIYTEEARNLLPKSPPLYDLESLTDRSERFVASETIRSALFEIFRKEIPYCCEVQINSFKEPKEEDKKPVLKIHATVIVERESQKGIVVGKGGEKIKEVGISAREKLEEFFQKRVYLNLSVRVNKDWRKSESKLKEYGYIQ